MTTDSSPNPQIRKRGVVGVILDDQSRWLVIRRSEAVRAPGWYCFPGGAIEAGESQTEALIREMDEEIGARVRPIQSLYQSVTSWGVHLTWWHAELLQPSDSLVANPAEVAEIQWLPPREIGGLDRLLESNHEFLAAWERGDFTV